MTNITTVGESYVELYNSTWFTLTGKTQLFRFYPRTTGEHIVYFGRNTTATDTTNRAYRHKVVKSGDASVNKWRTGSEIVLAPGSMSLIVKSLGCTIASSTLNWYPRYP